MGVAAAEGAADAGELEATATLGVATGGFSSSFARVELFLQPASKRGRTNKSARIRRCIPITKGADYHVLKNYKVWPRVFYPMLSMGNALHIARMLWLATTILHS